MRTRDPTVPPRLTQSACEACLDRRKTTTDIRVFVAPTNSHRAVTPSNGESDVIVNAGEPVRSPVNVWVHEYRHTRQTFETAPAMDGSVRAASDYHTAALTYSTGGIEADQLRERVTTEPTKPPI